MSDSRRSISAEVALRETAALADFYRNRLLLTAQENAELREQLATAQTAAMSRASAESEDKK